MEQSINEVEPSQPKRFWFYTLIGLGLLLIVLVAGIAYLADSFTYHRIRDADGNLPYRPIREVVYLAWVASAVTLIAIAIGLAVSRTQRWLWATIFAVGIACRLTLVFSNPILEVDYYRYIWDGIAANQGVSPYQFSPDEVRHGTYDDEELEKLQGVIAKHKSAKTIVSRVHFEKYTTLYPPVSQFFFRLTTKLIPNSASVERHIIAMKAMLVLFDIGTILCLAWLIAVLKKHPAWLIAYAWNPLVLKEIANGGHLDSIAVFFFTAGVAVFLWVAKRFERVSTEGVSIEGFGQSPSAPVWGSVVSGALIALGIGAKLFPIVVVPAMCWFLLARRQIKHLLAFSFSCLLFSACVLWPMFNHPQSPAELAGSVKAPVGETTDGLAVFITNWRMNDALFSFVYQNVEYDWGGREPAWYVVVPNETRIKWYEELRPIELANGNPAYFVARLATLGLFAMFYLWMLWKIWKTESAIDFAGILFLVMGVFFYLQPTQNPWYWLWAMPLVCFAKNRGWLFVSLALFVYYTRFWFEEMNESFEVFDVTYVGVHFFDHCLVWVEFLIVIAVLIVCRFVGLLLEWRNSKPNIS